MADAKTKPIPLAKGATPKGILTWAWLDKGRFLRRAPNAPATGAAERYLSLNLTAQF